MSKNPIVKPLIQLACVAIIALAWVAIRRPQLPSILVRATPVPTEVPTVTLQLPDLAADGLSALGVDAARLCERGVESPAPLARSGASIEGPFVLAYSPGSSQSQGYCPYGLPRPVEATGTATPSAAAPATYRYCPFPLEAPSASEVRAVVCVANGQKQVGMYDDGAAAYQEVWDTRVLSWPDGQLVRRTTFDGDMPPETKPAGYGPRTGAEPVAKLLDYLRAAWAPSGAMATGKVWALAVSPDGSRVAARVDGSIDVWDARALKRTARITVRDRLDASMPKKLAFTSDGRLVLLETKQAGQNSVLRIYRPDFRLAKEIELESKPFGAMIVSGSALVLANSSSVSRVDLDTFAVTPLSKFTGEYPYELSPDGSRWATWSSFQPVVRQTSDGAQLEATELHELGFVSVEGIAPDGRTLLVGPASGTVGEKAWTVLDFPSGGILATLADASPAKAQPMFYGDGRMIAAGYGPLVVTWDLGTGKATARRGHMGAVEHIAIGGNTLASASADGTVRAWDLATPAP